MNKRERLEQARKIHWNDQQDLFSAELWAHLLHAKEQVHTNAHVMIWFAGQHQPATLTQIEDLLELMNTSWTRQQEARAIL